MVRISKKGAATGASADKLGAATDARQENAWNRIREFNASHQYVREGMNLVHAGGAMHLPNLAFSSAALGLGDARPNFVTWDEDANDLAIALGAVAPPPTDLATAATDAIDALGPGDALPPVHPGEILLEDFIRPYGLTPIRVAKRLGVPRTRIERLVAGVTPVTVDTALRLERLFGASAEFWLQLQLQFDLTEGRAQADTAIATIEPLEV